MKKYFVIFYDKTKRGVIERIESFYDADEILQNIFVWKEKGELFCVYKGECITDLS